MASEAAKKKIAGLLSGAPKGGDLPRGLLSKGSMSKYTPTMREKIAGLLAKNWYGDTREGYKQANRLVNVGETVVPPLGLLSGSYDAGRALGGGNMMQAGVLGGLAMLPLPGAAKKGIKAYHGSPHSFDKFSMDKIGTGEGYDAYGRGLYFAEREDVAQTYKKPFGINGIPSWTMPTHIDGKPASQWKPTTEIEKRASDTLARLPNVDEAISYLEQDDNPIANGAREWLQKNRARISEPGGHMYEVSIDADPNQFLDWDQPLKAQPENVRSAIAAEMKANKYPQSKIDEVTSELAGQQAVNYLMPSGNKSQAADVLKSRGIPGIKYLDAGSRTKADGSRNYVVFDEKLISIVRKYGIAGASTMLGYDILSNVTDDQAKTLQRAEKVY